MSSPADHTPVMSSAMGILCGLLSLPTGKKSYIPDIMARPDSPEYMLVNAVALLLAVRCQQEEASKQLLAKIYHDLKEKTAKQLMFKVIMLMTPKERDWLRDLV